MVQIMELILNSRGVEYTCYYDHEDHDLISGHKWRINHNGYAVTSIKGCTVLMHRLILGLTDRSMQVDHRDHGKLNNQRSNLRICSNAENQYNRLKGKNLTSQFKGVRRQRGKWRAEIKKAGKKYHIGYFRSEVTAAHCYDHAARQKFGTFANPNFRKIRQEPVQLKLSLYGGIII